MPPFFLTRYIFFNFLDFFSSFSFICFTFFKFSFFSFSFFINFLFCNALMSNCWCRLLKCNVYRQKDWAIICSAELWREGDLFCWIMMLVDDRAIDGRHNFFNQCNYFFFERPRWIRFSQFSSRLHPARCYTYSTLVRQIRKLFYCRSRLWIFRWLSYYFFRIEWMLLSVIWKVELVFIFFSCLYWCLMFVYDRFGSLYLWIEVEFCLSIFSW